MFPMLLVLLIQSFVVATLFYFRRQLRPPGQ